MTVARCFVKTLGSTALFKDFSRSVCGFAALRSSAADADTLRIPDGGCKVGVGGQIAGCS
jgi:hypothetical protein